MIWHVQNENFILDSTRIFMKAFHLLLFHGSFIFPECILIFGLILLLMIDSTSDQKDRPWFYFISSTNASPSSGGFLLLLLSLRGISNRFQLLFPSQGQVLTRYSPVRHWKHHFPSDLHVLSMPPAFILSQDRTLHEIHSCITYSFLVRRQS
ncbi:hypothetical protein C4D60_Mb00t09540 [Musa balbisiana]|uniref:NAD(P)H-quinone oxidoreductase subunit 2 N-terminal domain-containing protein n=1 Tax=Musa balbisiana TaxID=52838 RepID=A0A4S8I6V4_MUSBA|nr:hypothetical protein C4D60_Mb00t09540 [Musa balbisiana]